MATSLEEKGDAYIELNSCGMLNQCMISKKQGRHRLFLGNIKQKLKEAETQIGDLLFFEKDLSVEGRFNILILSSSNEVRFASPSSSIIGENRTVYSTSRVGHEIFREQVRAIYSYRCCVCNLDDTQPSILIASHIKPWRFSDKTEKVDKYNGLLLAPHYDKLFDLGLISFSNNGDIMISSKVTQEMNQELCLEERRINVVFPQTARYLAFHREYFDF